VATPRLADVGRADARGALAGLRYPLAVWAASRLGVYLVLAMQSWTTREPPGSGLSWRAVASPLGDWDAVWYGWIAEHGYDPAIGHGNTVAFFPLYPLAWRAAAFVLPGPMTLAATILSSLLFGAALCLLYRMTQGRYGEAMARRTVLYLAVFPLAFVFSLPYAESLFLLLVLGAFALTWYGRWWAGCAVGALAVLARPVGIALLPALAWRLWREGRRDPAAFAPLLLLAAAEAGFLAYAAWLTGDPLAHVHAQERGWGRGLNVLPVLVADTLWSEVLQEGQLRFLVHVAFTVLWVWLFWRAWRRLRLPGEYLLFSALMVLLPTTGGLVVSMGRMGMVAFPLFWALADAGADERVDTLVKTVSPLLLAALVFITFGPRTFTP
jgi:hypothetical protein